MRGPTFIKFSPGGATVCPRLCQEIPAQIASFISQKHMFKVKPCHGIIWHTDNSENRGQMRKIKMTPCFHVERNRSHFYDCLL